MQAMTQSFICLQYLGVWRPEHWFPGWKTKLYNCYTLFVILMIVTVAFSELIELIETNDGIESLANKSVFLLSLIVNIGKATNMLIKRGDIVALINVLEKDPCRPRTEEELAMQNKVDNWINFIFLRYWTLGGLSVCAATWKSLVEDVPQRSLPFACFVEFDYDKSLLVYWIVYVYQIVALILSAGIGMTFDIFVAGLLLQTCGQLHILKHRFHEMPEILNNNSHSGNKFNLLSQNLESSLLSHWVKHHIEIFKFAETTNDLFYIMIFIQYSISSLILCVSVFGLATTTLFTPEFSLLVTYTATVGVQIFIYCYYGCKLTLESLSVGDAIYATNWHLLSAKMQRSLVMMMIRALKPIKFTTGYIVTLNLDYFNSLLKISYSAYNVLKQTSS